MGSIENGILEAVRDRLAKQLDIDQEIVLAVVKTLREPGGPTAESVIATVKASVYGRAQ